MTDQLLHVTFLLRPEDFKAWWIFQSWRPRANRLSLWFGAFAIAFVGLGVGNRYALSLETILALGVVGAVTGYFLVRYLMTAGVLAFATAQFKSAAGQTQLGEYRLTIDPSRNLRTGSERSPRTRLAGR